MLQAVAARRGPFSTGRLARSIRGLFALAAVGTVALPGPIVLAQGVNSFRRADADGSGSVLLTDAVVVLNFLFLGGRPPVCTPVANADGDGQLNITDGVFILGFLFFGSAPPPPLTRDEINQCRGLTPEAIQRGMEVFENPDPAAFREPPGANAFSCTLCHGFYDNDNQDSFIRAGHTLLNSLVRPSWKAGRVTAFVGAANVCRTDWMAADPWQESDQEFQDLVTFFKSVETVETAPALEFQIVAPAASGPPATGDGEAGCRLFNRSCAICHQQGAVGGGDPPLAVSLVDLNVTALDDPDYVRRRIRLSGPPSDASVYQFPQSVNRDDSISVMPFWAQDKLTDQQVEDMVAFAALARAEARAGNTTFNCTDEPPPPDGNALRRGNLTTRQHGVAGIVEELDTRRIRIREFNYDGGGARVQVWLYQNGRINRGTPIGPDLVRTPRVNATLVVDIPESIPSDAFDSVSIWCVQFGVDFGHARLEPVTP